MTVGSIRAGSGTESTFRLVYISSRDPLPPGVVSRMPLAVLDDGHLITVRRELPRSMREPLPPDHQPTVTTTAHRRGPGANGLRVTHALEDTRCPGGQILDRIGSSNPRLLEREPGSRNPGGFSENAANSRPIQAASITVAMNNPCRHP